MNIMMNDDKIEVCGIKYTPNQTKEDFLKFNLSASNARIDMIRNSDLNISTKEMALTYEQMVSDLVMELYETRRILEEIQNDRDLLLGMFMEFSDYKKVE